MAISLETNKPLTLQGSGDVYWGINLSDVASKIDAAVPDDAEITEVKLNFSGTAYNNGLLYAYNEYAVIGLTNSDADAITNNSGGTGGTNLYKYGPFEIGNKKTVSLDPKSIVITNYFKSTAPHSVQNTSYSRLSVAFSSKATYKKTYTFNLSVDVTYKTIPKYTATFQNYDGTVLQTVTVQSGSTPSYTGATPTRPTDAQYTYTFSGWDKAIGGITSDTRYTAQFTATPRVYKIEVDCPANSDSGEKATVSGAGTYKYGDTVTLQANIPAYHRFFGWLCFDLRLQYDKTNPLVFTIDDEFGNALGEDSYIYFTCYIEHTGFLLKANVSPEGSGVVEQGLAGTYESGEDYYLSEGILSAEGILVKYGSRNSYGIKAIANEGYEFVGWSDGNADNPRKLNLTGDAIFTAIFEKSGINNIYRGVKAQAVFKGTKGAGEIAVYKGNSKVFE